MPSTPGAPLLRTTARNAASMLPGSQIASIRSATRAGLSGSGAAVATSTSGATGRGASPLPDIGKSSVSWIGGRGVAMRRPSYLPSPSTPRRGPFGPSAPGAACRVGGGALDCSRAGLRPPLKLNVRFSRIQLSRRRFPLSSDGRDHRNQVHEPVLAVELVVRQGSPSTAAPPLVPVRPDPPHQPLVEPVKEPSDVGPLVVVAPPSHDGIELLDQLHGTHRSLAPR